MRSRGCGSASTDESDEPVGGVLVQLSELPVHWVDVHVVVLLKVLRKQLDRVIASMKTPLALKDFLHLQNNPGRRSLTHFDQQHLTFCRSFPSHKDALWLSLTD